jgi:hypothetical protein
MAAGYGGGAGITGATTIEEAQEQYPSFTTVGNLELKRLLESRRSGIEIIDETIIDIHERTDRAIKGQRANKFEFVYICNRSLKAPFHAPCHEVSLMDRLISCLL